jgi:hypothetical protein
MREAEDNAPTPDTKAGARQMKLKQILESDPSKAKEAPKQKFADPAMAGKRVKKVASV